VSTSRPLSWILQILVAVILTPAAISKLAGSDPSIDLFTQLEIEPAGRFLIGVIEMLAVILLLVPASVAWGAILAWGVMSGAVIAHATVLGLGEPVPPIGLPLAIMAAINWLGTTAILVLRRREIEFIRNMFPEQEPSPNKP